MFFLSPGCAWSWNVDADMLTGARCARYGCTFVHRRGRRRHGFCCSACHFLECFHICNCSGAGKVVEDDDGVVPPLLEVLALQRTGIRDEVRMLCLRGCRGDGVVMSSLDWYSSRYNLASALTMRMRRRGVPLYAFRDDSVSSEFAGYFRSVSCLFGRSQLCEGE